MEHQDNEALDISRDQLLQEYSESESQQSAKKPRGRPRKFKQEMNDMQTSQSPKKSTEPELEIHPLFQDKFMPTEDYLSANNSIIKPSKYGVPFSISIFSSKQDK